MTLAVRVAVCAFAILLTNQAWLVASDAGTCAGDAHEQCGYWASIGECERNARYMIKSCPAACGECKADAGIIPEDTVTGGTSDGETMEEGQCKDMHEKCDSWAREGECDKNPKYMLLNCMKSCLNCPAENAARETRFGVEQTVSGDKAEETARKLKEAIEYMETVVLNDKVRYPDEIATECLNRNELCAFWAAIGECEANPGFMQLQCAPVCKSCEQLDINARCPFDPDNHPELPDALGPGDLHRMYEKIVAPDSPFQRFKPVIHVRPYTPGAEGIEGQPLEEGQIEGPWVVTFDAFLSPEEARIMIQLGYEEGYERSTDVGKKKFDGTYDKHESQGRTSTNAWCKEKCMANATAVELLERIDSITGIPYANYESFQLLRYETSQHYNVHHDFIEHQVDRMCGPRILTFFLYLSDVEEGGGTNFPHLGENGITITPKVGRALLWPSVLNEDPNVRDKRTYHQALPVVKGLKYACNSWIHLRNFENSNKLGCT